MAETARAGLISVVGGESTGKSTLAAALGERLPGIVVPEALRAWVDENRGRVPLPSEQTVVMTAHHESEVTALHQADSTGSPWVISDGGPLMTAVYSLQYYNDASLLPLALEWTARSHAVLWCQDDFPWQPDSQRDGIQARTASQQILSAIFREHPALPVQVVHGPLDERIATVAAAVAQTANGAR